ncbi:MAG: PH domain-containing protein [Armatimonadota bacterium]
MESEARVYNAAPMEPAIIGVTLFIVGLMAYMIYGGLTWEGSLLYTAGFLALLIIFCAQYKPTAYEIGSESVNIIRGWPFSPIVIPISSVTSVDKLVLKGMTIRTFGVGGLFSAGGWFWNKKIGSFFGAITDSKRTILITANKKYAISPDEPNRFIEDLRTRAGLGA